jgi:hypothetical protein
VPTVLLIGLLPVQAATFRYLWHHFTNVTSPYTTVDSVSGSFSIAALLEANQPLSPITPSSFSFSDGIQTLTNLNATSLAFEVFTRRIMNRLADGWDKMADNVMQEIVVAPLGYWRDSSRGKGTVNALSPGVYADLGRAPTFSDTLVEVAVAEVVAAG